MRTRTMKRSFPLSLMLLTLVLASISGKETTAGTYTTNFPLSENPISEGGNWINGETAGLDWKNVSTTPGLAIGTQTGSDQYADSTALLSGTWGPNQSAQATVYTVNQNQNFFEEVEIRLRSAISAHSNTGYEILFRCVTGSSAYVQIVRWNGPRSDFTILTGVTGPGLRNGDVVKATVMGSVITAYINDTPVLQATDGTYPNGNPGIGFYLEGATGVNGDFGFRNFSATDGVTSSPKIPLPPSDIHIVPAP